MRKTKHSAGSLPLFSPSKGRFEQIPDWPFDKDTVPDYRFEQFLTEHGYQVIAGTDEAGRGPLAGPVVAAAVILPINTQIDGLNDSKKLTENKRQTLFDVIMECAMAVSITSICAETIDQTDIRKASLEAMRRCFLNLAIRPDALLVDGRDVPPNLPAELFTQPIVKGDGRSMSIAAAAIIAKVTRDRMMTQLGDEYPAYGLERHMGYGSAFHRATISEHGGQPRIHRFSFRPLKQD